MCNEAAFHDGYAKALEAMRELMAARTPGSVEDYQELLREITARIERARCNGRSSLASTASGSKGY